MNNFKLTLLFGLFFGVLIGFVSINLSNLFIAGHSIIASLVFMMGLPTEKRNKWLNYFFWFLVVSIIPAWIVYLVL